ncbi:pyridoxal-phosphate dependent enzyme [Fusibacter bizertensis]|uniref:Pyridoxal-phosphate dependent enzyme n=1 Tax=Fusibacter bizertensis TaxID=1488331 RepID=A0ABT6NE37_9FIRM|nr:pyridoxal-phosphate dependent enzyme [Fusibacter bizertensis]MDH8678693.1 pyridoxal-phosphate dependent enzyme [Fusibacter bizertensis]
MHLSGQTPLFRAKNLEKYLGLDAIYLKLEGSNPTGHKNDRIAEALVKYAEEVEVKSIFVYGTEQYLKSIYYFASAKEFDIYAPKTKETTPYYKKYPDINWLTIPVKKNDSSNDVFEQYAQEQGYIYLSEWEKKPFIRGLAIQKMMEESIDKIGTVGNVWTQINGGYTLRSIYHEAMRKWVDGTMEHMPKFHCGLSSSKLSVLEESESIHEIVTTTKANTIAITQDELKEAVKLLRKLEHIKIKPSEAYSIAAMIQKHDNLKGNHLVFLNDGRNEIELDEISNNKGLDKEEVVAITRKLLEPYNDSIGETEDAVQKAIDKGFIFKATRNGEIQGICIIVHMGFETFIPSYHLAYIGVKKGNSGRGVATELINQAIEKTGGNLSLHVDIPNGRAKKLYEKMGFVHTYDRMLYKG